MALTPDTDEKLALGMAVLRDLADKGRIPPPPYSAEAIAHVCGVSPATINGITRIIRARTAAGLLKQGNLPPRLAREISKILSNP